MLTLDENQFLTNATWAEYSEFLQAVADKPVRLTFDRGRLEIMSPSPDHEKMKSVLRMLLEGLLIDWDLDFEPGGSTTFRSEELEKGLEPDECYWLRNAVSNRQIRGRPWTFGLDAAPELVIEVEITSSVLNRLSLLHSLGVGEVWRMKSSGEIVVLCRGPERYEETTSSKVIPGFPTGDISRWLVPSDLTRPQQVRAFVAWARSFKS